MTPTNRIIECLTAAATAVAFAGCTSMLAPRPDPARFYLLTPTADSTGAPSQISSADLTIGLGPIKLPSYLDRAEVVTRAAPNRIELSKTDRWGESLQNAFISVLSRDLAAQLGNRRIMTFPWYSTAHIDLQVQVEVYRFETDSRGDAQLSANWTILSGLDKKILYSAESNLTQSSKPGDATDGAAALSRTVGDLSREIANMVNQVRSEQRIRHS